MLDSERRNWKSRFELWLYRNHSWVNALRVAFAIAAIYCAIGWGSAKIWPCSELIQESSGQLLSVVEIAGGVYAVLLAVVALSVQLHAQRNDENAFMVSYLMRKHSSFWVMGIAVGVVVANAVIPMLADGVIPINRTAIDVLNGICLPLVLSLSLWFVACTVRDATRSTFDSSMRPFVHDMAQAVALDLYRWDLNSCFLKKLQEHGIEYSPWGGMLSGTQELLGAYSLPPDRFIVDIDEGALDRILDEIRGLGKVTAEFRLGPGRMTDAEPVLVIKAAPNDRGHKGGPETELLPPLSNVVEVSRAASKRISDQLDRTLQDLVGRAFIFGQQKSGVADELNEFLRRFGLRLRTLAKYGSSIELSEALARLRELILHWATLAPGTETAFRMGPFSDNGSQFNGPLAVEIRDVVVYSLTSGDEEKVQDMAWFLARVFSDGRRARHLRLMGNVRELLQLAYYQGVRHGGVDEVLRRSFDSILHSVLGGFDSRRVRSRGAGLLPSDNFDEERAYLAETLSLGLGLLRSAMEAGQAKDAGFFFGRLIEHRKYRTSDWGVPVLEQETSDSLHDYLVLTSFAWALHLLERGREAPQVAAGEILQAAKRALPPAHRIVSVWEFYFAGATLECSADVRLGTINWDYEPDADSRSGVIVSSYRVDWRKRGLFAALLCVGMPRDHEIPQYFPNPPERHMWNLEIARPELEDLSTRECLGLSGEVRERAVENVCRLLGTREFASERIRALQEASESLSPSRVEAYRREVIEECRAGRSFVQALRRAGAGSEPVVFASPCPQTLRQHIPRTYVLDGENWATGFGEEFARFAGSHETFLLINICKSICDTEAVTRFSDLREELHSARADLESRGFTPDLVIIPRERWFSSALFSQPRWKLRDSHQDGSLPDWEGMRVVEWDVNEAPFVVVCEASEFWGTTVKGGCPVVLNVEDTTGAEKEEFLEKVGTARSLLELPNRGSLKAVGVITQIAEFGVRKREAAILLNTERTKLGYAIQRGETVYHLVTCARLESMFEVTFIPQIGLHESGATMTPCPDCSPGPLM